MEAVLDVADDIGLAGVHLRVGKRDEAFEAEAEMAERLQMVAQCLADTAGTDDQDAAGVDAFAIAAVDQRSPQRAPCAKHGSCQQDGEDDHDARDDLTARQVNRTAQDKAADQGGLQRHSLFVQAAAVLDGTV